MPLARFPSTTFPYPISIPCAILLPVPTPLSLLGGVSREVVASFVVDEGEEEKRPRSSGKEASEVGGSVPRRGRKWLIKEVERYSTVQKCALRPRGTILPPSLENPAQFNVPKSFLSFFQVSGLRPWSDTQMGVGPSPLKSGNVAERRPGLGEKLRES